MRYKKMSNFAYQKEQRNATQPHKIHGKESKGQIRTISHRAAPHRRVRTALYNYLFARQHGGDMILRIEDTDSNRFVPGAEDYINEALAWLGIGIDEGVREGGKYGPYKQSERRDIYRAHVKKLLDAGKAYIAFDTPEELEKARAEMPNFQYDASTRMAMRNSCRCPKRRLKN